jgi:hypothetical protein
MITMSGLGRLGQWGNQIFQYAFIRTYAKRHGIPYQCAPWAGQEFFGHEDPPVSVVLPDRNERRKPYPNEPEFGFPLPPEGPEFHGSNFTGWAQYHTSWYAPDKDFIQGLFRPTAETAFVYSPLLNRVKTPDSTLVVLHLRRGDAGRMIYFLTPILWCLEWLDTNWGRFNNPIFYLATEDVSLKPWFADYGVRTADDLGVAMRAISPRHYEYPWDKTGKFARQMTFFPDWYVMQNADVVVAAESTFGVSAAWTNTCIKEFWRPRLSLRGFEQCDPWDMDVSPREHLDDYPDIPGVQIDSNPDFASHWRNYKPRHPSVPETRQSILEWLRTHSAGKESP